MSCPGVSFLVTSRSSLQLTWEQTVSVSPLRVPELNQAWSVEARSEIASIALFVQRAQARQADFAGTPEKSRLVPELCRHLDGLPLGSGLAAAQMNVLPLSTIVSRLQDRLLLQWQTVDLPDRHRSLEVAVGWSCDLNIGRLSTTWRGEGVLPRRDRRHHLV
jgi:non-specific serine/threonine protein kinase